MILKVGMEDRQKNVQAITKLKKIITKSEQ